MLSMIYVSVYLLDLYFSVICLNVSRYRLMGLLGTHFFFLFVLGLGLWCLMPLSTVFQLYIELFSNKQT
jgi:hypothetical protein